MNSSIFTNICYQCYFITSDYEVFRKDVLQATAIVMLFLALFGSLFNGLFIYILLKHNIVKTRNNIYVITLCVSSIGIAVLVVPTVGIASLEDKWMFGEVGCALHGFIMTTFGLIQIFVLAVMSFEKYIIVVRNNWDSFVSKNGTRFTIAGCLMLGVILGSCPLFGWNSYKLELQRTSCSIDWGDKSIKSLTYTYLLLLVGLVVPVSVMFFSYINIYLEIRRHIFNLHNVLRNSGKSYANMLKREVKVIKTMFILVCAFIFSWVPYSVMSIYAMFNDINSLDPLLYMLPTLFAKASVIWNPIIYLFINKSFKKALLDKIPILRKCCSCRLSKGRRELLSNETGPSPTYFKDGKSFDQQHTLRTSSQTQMAITIL
ncbi:visual pigment-like receptor peropsin [Mizuhopecten yessoensis]|uniref:visual pigment-like receptor peropsin n=1 Tax=Mizuhopecten yessoensis TaxID=6573 RepID=UPI000B457909|nr:visual pigment-like receptor peropsin [Mizuhopecten yessoensis]